MKWIKDEEFIRGNIPMTKFNIRTLTIGYLQIQSGDRLLDIGAGTGSISIESFLQGADVWAIEREEEGISLIEENIKKFNAQIQLIKGQAPEDLPNIRIDKCFIGGSGGKLKEIYSYLDNNLEMGGVVVSNFITLKNLTENLELLKRYNYKRIETQLIQSAYIENNGLIKGQNPIYIVKGVKSNG